MGIKPLMEANEFHDKLCEGKLTRRQAHKVMASAGVGTLACTTLPGVANADGSDIVMYTWGGYDDKHFAQEYQKKYGSPPSYSLFADQAEALAKLRAGFHADVMFPCISKVKLWYDAGVIAPIDVSLLSHYDDMLTPLKTLPTANLPDGTPLFISEDWGQTSVLFRADLAPEYVPADKQTWGILWDKKFKGRLGAIESVEDHFNTTAIYLGINFLDMTDAQIKQVAAKLRQQLPLLRLVTGDTTSLTQALFSGELIATSAWNGMMLTATQEMQKQGTPGKYVWMHPKEGVETWVCGLTISPATKKAGTWKKAHDLINAYIAPDSQHYELMNWGYGVANSKAYQYKDVTEDYLHSIGLGLPVEKYLADGVFSAYQKRYGKIVGVYNQVLAGM